MVTIDLVTDDREVLATSDRNNYNSIAIHPDGRTAIGTFEIDVQLRAVER